MVFCECNVHMCMRVDDCRINLRNALDNSIIGITEIDGFTDNRWRSHHLQFFFLYSAKKMSEKNDIKIQVIIVREYSYLKL